MLLHSLNCLLIVMLFSQTCGDFLQKRSINEPNFPESVDAFFDTGSQEDLEDNFSNLRFFPLLQVARNLDKRSTDERSMKLEKHHKIKSTDIINFDSNRLRDARGFQKRKRYSFRLSDKLKQDINELNDLVQLVNGRGHSKFRKKKFKRKVEITHPFTLKPIAKTSTSEPAKIVHTSKANDIKILDYDEDEDYADDDKKIFSCQNKNAVVPTVTVVKPFTEEKTTLKKETNVMVSCQPTTQDSRPLKTEVKTQITIHRQEKIVVTSTESPSSISWPEKVEKIILEAEEKLKVLQQHQLLLKRKYRQNHSNFNNAALYEQRKRDEEMKDLLEEAEKKIENLQKQKRLLNRALNRKIRQGRNSLVYNPELDKRKQELRKGIGDICAFEARLERHQELYFRDLGFIDKPIEISSEAPTPEPPVTSINYPSSYGYAGLTYGYPSPTYEYPMEPILSTVKNVEICDETTELPSYTINKEFPESPCDEDFLSEPPDYFTDNDVERAFNEQEDCDSVLTERITEKLLQERKRVKKRRKRGTNFPDLPVHQKKIDRLRFLNEEMQKFPVEKNLNEIKSQKLLYFPIHYQQKRSDKTTKGKIKTTTTTTEVINQQPKGAPTEGQDSEQMFPSTLTEYTELSEPGELPSGTFNSVIKDKTDSTTQDNEADTISIHESHPEEHQLEENLKFPEKTEDEQNKNTTSAKNTTKPLQKLISHVKDKVDSYVQKSTVKDVFEDEIKFELPESEYEHKSEKVKEKESAPKVHKKHTHKTKVLSLRKRQDESETEGEFSTGTSQETESPTEQRNNEDRIKAEANTKNPNRVIEDLTRKLHLYEKQVKMYEQKTGKKSEEMELLLADIRRKLYSYEKQAKEAKAKEKIIAESEAPVEETKTNSEDSEEAKESAESSEEESKAPVEGEERKNEEPTDFIKPNEEFPDESVETPAETEIPPTEEEPLEDTTLSPDQVLEDIENELSDYENHKSEIEEIPAPTEPPTEKSTAGEAEKLLDEIQEELEEFETKPKQPEDTEEPETLYEEEEHETETAEQVVDEIQNELEEFEEHVKNYEEAKTSPPEEITESEEEEVTIMPDIEHTEEPDLENSEETPTEEPHETTKEDTKEILNDIKHQLENLENHVEHDTYTKKNEESETVSSAEQAEEMLDEIESELEDYEKHETESTAETVTISESTPNELINEIQQKIEENGREDEVYEEEKTEKTNTTQSDEAVHILENIQHQLEDFNKFHSTTTEKTTSEIEQTSPFPTETPAKTEEEIIITDEPIIAEAEHLLQNIQHEIKHFKEEHTPTTETEEPTTGSLDKIIHTIKEEIEVFKEQEETQTEEEEESSEETYDDLYAELQLTNHQIILSDKCSLSQFRAKDHCICSVKQMLQDLMDDVALINKTGLYEYTCKRFIRIDPGIIITNKSESKILRKRKTGDFTDSFIWKRSARVGRDIESLLRKDINLSTKDNITYVSAGTKVIIPCSDIVAYNKNIEYSWTVQNGAPETTGDRMNNGSSIVISSVSPEDTNNYTCKLYDRKSHVKGVHVHWLSVVSLPLYSLVVTVHLNASSKCQDGDIEILNLYYPVALQDLLCSGSAKICSVTVEKPQCIRLGTENIISLHATLSAEPLLSILPQLNPSVCSLRCQNRMYSIIVGMLLKNLASVTNLPVFFRLNYRTAELTPIQNNWGDKTNVVTNSINTVCPAGFGIFRNPKICLACEPYTFNPGNEMSCQRCPRGTFQRAIGSRMCLPCNSILDDPSCFLPGTVADMSRKYYLIPVVLMITTLALIAACVIFHKRESRPFVFRKVGTVETDDDMSHRFEEHSKKSSRASRNMSLRSLKKELKVIHDRDPSAEVCFTSVSRSISSKKSKPSSRSLSRNRRPPPTPPPIDF